MTEILTSRLELEEDIQELVCVLRNLYDAQLLCGKSQTQWEEAMKNAKSLLDYHDDADDD